MPQWNARAEDPKLGALSNVIHQWGAIIGTQRTSAKKLIDTATDTGPTRGYSNLNPREFLHPDFREALLVVAGDGGVINSRRLGIWLASVKGRIVDGSRIIDDGIVAGIAQWRLEQKE